MSRKRRPLEGGGLVGSVSPGFGKDKLRRIQWMPGGPRLILASLFNPIAPWKYDSLKMHNCCKEKQQQRQQINNNNKKKKQARNSCLFSFWNLLFREGSQSVRADDRSTTGLTRLKVKSVGTKRIFFPARRNGNYHEITTTTAAANEYPAVCSPYGHFVRRPTASRPFSCYCFSDKKSTSDSRYYYYELLPIFSFVRSFSCSILIDKNNDDVRWRTVWRSTWIEFRK